MKDAQTRNSLLVHAKLCCVSEFCDDLGLVQERRTAGSLRVARGYLTWCSISLTFPGSTIQRITEFQCDALKVMAWTVLIQICFLPDHRDHSLLWNIFSFVLYLLQFLDLRPPVSCSVRSVRRKINLQGNQNWGNTRIDVLCADITHLFNAHVLWYSLLLQDLISTMYAEGCPSTVLFVITGLRKHELLEGTYYCWSVVFAVEVLV